MSQIKQCPACGFTASYLGESCPRCGSNLRSPRESNASMIGTPQPLPSQPIVTGHTLHSPSPVEDQQPLITTPEPAQQFLSEQHSDATATRASSSDGMCAQHPSVPAEHRCSSCGVGVCSTCSFVIPSPVSETEILGIRPATRLCPNCMSARGAGVGAPGLSSRRALPLPSGEMCTRHSEVRAVRRCGVCRATMCETCDFELPGHFHVCPGCATNPKRELSPGRKRKLIISYILAVWSTLTLALVFSGVLAEAFDPEQAEQAIGVIFSVFVFFPSLAGTALSISTRDKKLDNPPAVWGAVIWNGLVLGVIVLLVIIGNLM